MPTVTKPTFDELTAMETLSRFPPWSIISTRISREIEAIRTHLVGTPDVDRLRQLQGQAQALESMREEISNARQTLRLQQE